MTEVDVRLLIEDGWYREQTFPGSGRMVWAKVTKPDGEHCTLVERRESEWLLTTVYPRIGQRCRLFHTVDAAMAYLKTLASKVPVESAHQLNGRYRSFGS